MQGRVVGDRGLMNDESKKRRRICVAAKHAPALISIASTFPHLRLADILARCCAYSEGKS